MSQHPCVNNCHWNFGVFLGQCHKNIMAITKCKGRLPSFAPICFGLNLFFTYIIFTLLCPCWNELLEHSCSWFASVKVRTASVHSLSPFLPSLKENQPKLMYFSSWWSGAVSHLTQVALLALFSAVCACTRAFSHICYLILCFLMPSLSDCLCFSVTVSQNGSNNPLLPSQRKGTIALLYWVNAFSHTCRWMGDYLNILNTLLIGIMTC